MSDNLRSLVENFTSQLVAAVETAATERVQRAMLAALGNGTVRRGPGRPRKNALFAPAASVAKKARRKRPKQFCPVPGCKNVAAPVFGMVCSKHKDVAKSKIRQYREARRKSAI